MVTVSRVLPGAIAAGLRDVQTLTRQKLRDMIRNSLDSPIGTATQVGRPSSGLSVVDVVIVAKEQHADDSAHFHIVVKLTSRRRFRQAKAHTYTSADMWLYRTYTYTSAAM